MNARRRLGSVLVFPMLAWLGAGCGDGAGTSRRSPTGPGMDASAQGALASRSDDGDFDGGNGPFRLFGNARMVRDPENPSNVVMQLVSNAQFTASGASRDLGVKIWQLDHMVSFHRAFVAPHTCGGGSPRVSLLVDANGDGRFQQAPAGPDFVAHGHVRPPFAACETSAPTPASGPSPSTLLWRFEDLTDEQVRWEITPSNAIPGVVIGPIGGAGAVNWDGLEAAISTALPNHRVLRGQLLEDFSPTPGLAYYDLITIYDATLGTKGQVQAGRRERDGDDNGDRDEKH